MLAISFINSWVACVASPKRVPDSDLVFEVEVFAIVKPEKAH